MTVKVTLNGKAPSGGAVVMLASSNSTAVPVPASVTVAAGATSASVLVTTGRVASTASATLTASYNGSTKSAVVSVTAPGLSGVTLAPTSVTAGKTVTGTVTISGAAPAAVSV